MNSFDLTVWLLAGIGTSIRIVSYSGRRFFLERLPSLGVSILVILWVSFGAAYLMGVFTKFGIALMLICLVQVVVFPVLISVDIVEHKVPTALLQVSGAIVAVVLLCTIRYLPVYPIIESTCLLVLPYLLVNVVKFSSIGSGDLRLCMLLGPLIGLFLGPLDAINVNLLACTGAVVAAMFFRSVLGMKITKIPLAPFLITSLLCLECYQGVVSIGSQYIRSH